MHKNTEQIAAVLFIESHDARDDAILWNIMDCENSTEKFVIFNHDYLTQCALYYPEQIGNGSQQLQHVSQKITFIYKEHVVLLDHNIIKGTFYLRHTV